MQRIFRVPPCNRPSDPTAAGFTLIEIVIALALCGLVASVTAASLHAALGAERQAVQLRADRLAAAQVYQALLNPAQSETLLHGVKTEWNLTETAQSTGQGTNSAQWTVWTLTHREQANRQATVIVRE